MHPSMNMYPWDSPLGPSLGANDDALFQAVLTNDRTMMFATDHLCTVLYTKYCSYDELDIEDNMMQHLQ